jgi:hypothetical protein
VIRIGSRAQDPNKLCGVRHDIMRRVIPHLFNQFNSPDMVCPIRVQSHLRVFASSFHVWSPEPTMFDHARQEVLKAMIMSSLSSRSPARDLRSIVG